MFDIFDKLSMLIIVEGMPPIVMRQVKISLLINISVVIRGLSIVSYIADILQE
jgi:hypothetical protein